MSEKFKAIVINNKEEKFSREIQDINLNDLKDGNVLIKVDYSSLNYKDAMILKDGGRIVRKFPFVPGIDFSGTVVESDDKKFKEFSAINSTFQSPYNKNEPRQLKEIKSYVKKWNGNGKNLVLITHYSIITAITNTAPGSGEIVITDKNFNVLATIPTN